MNESQATVEEALPREATSSPNANLTFFMAIVTIGAFFQFCADVLSSRFWVPLFEHRVFGDAAVLGVSGVVLWLLIRFRDSEALTKPAGEVLSLVAGRIAGFFSKSEEVVVEEPKRMTAEHEEKVITHLLDRFQRDVFQIYVEPGLKSVDGRDLPKALKKLRRSKHRTQCADAAWDRAISRLNDRLRDVQNNWELRPETLARLGRGVRESGQVLITCHTSVKSWQ